MEDEKAWVLMERMCFKFWKEIHQASEKEYEASKHGLSRKEVWNRKKAVKRFRVEYQHLDDEE